jgi:hypothetical protein
MDFIDKMIDELVETYRIEDILPFPNADVRELEVEYICKFKEYAPEEFMKGDLDNYWAFIAGLASGGIRLKLLNTDERNRMKELLKGTFYDWYPKYKFLEGCDLSHYKDLYSNFLMYESFRSKLINIIEVYENTML